MESVIRLSLGKLSVNLLQVVKRTYTPLTPQHSGITFPPCLLYYMDPSIVVILVVIVRGFNSKQPYEGNLQSSVELSVDRKTARAVVSYGFLSQLVK